MSALYSLGIGKNSNNTPDANNIINKTSLAAGQSFQSITFYKEQPQLGFNEYWPVEYVSTGIATISSSNNSVDFGGIQATWRC